MKQNTLTLFIRSFMSFLVSWLSLSLYINLNVVFNIKDISTTVGPKIHMDVMLSFDCSIIRYEYYSLLHL